MIWGPYNMITPRRVKFPPWKDNKANVLSISYSSGWGLRHEMSALLSVYGGNLTFINSFDTIFLCLTPPLKSHGSFFRNWPFNCLWKFVLKLNNKGNHQQYHQILGSKHFPYQTFIIGHTHTPPLYYKSYFRLTRPSHQRHHTTLQLRIYVETTKTTRKRNHFPVLISVVFQTHKVKYMRCAQNIFSTQLLIFKQM